MKSETAANPVFHRLKRILLLEDPIKTVGAFWSETRVAAVRQSWEYGEHFEPLFY